ncbi:sulfatase-like hydrolase/transferase [Flavicella sediminum]|uniref:sulfatase-like hydrolase/transferase n=1 Tax=Flavicella sediminum TaxID=2585141 RepID=UPI00111D1DB2|nr:sulfatase-like hydrolase/transferase [Flavicella sediminum]
MRFYKIWKGLLAVLFLGIVSCTQINKKNKEAANAVEQNEKPNIILIYADDLGRGMLGTYGQKIVKTPNIDRLANQGMKFENSYGSHYCSPARASLLTGMHDVRRDLFNTTTGGIYMKLDNGLSLPQIEEKIEKIMIPAKQEEVFLGQVAQQAGYTTAEFGKLEWGFATTAARVKRHGWDYHFGYYDHRRCHGFYPPFLFRNGVKVDIPGNTLVDCGKGPSEESPENYKKRWDMTGKKVYSEHIIMDEMLGYLDKNNPTKTGKPFFIYFPTQLPHGPVAIPEVHEDFKNNPNLTEIEKEYASMVKMLDTDVGRIYEKLEKMGILDNTILVFTSDNGHAMPYPEVGRLDDKRNIHTGQKYDDIQTRFYSETSGDVFDGNDGMSGYKRSNWEGGSRVPLIWYWKNKIESGTLTEQRVANYDFMNTMAELIGVPEVKNKDGVSYAKTLLGGKSKERAYTVLSSHTMGPSLITKDGWKLRYYLKKEIFQLYYLPDDYKEEHNLSEKFPEKLEALKTLLYKECNGDWENGLGPKKMSAKLYGI